VQSPLTLRTFKPDDLDKVMRINQLCLPENYAPHFFMDLYEHFPETFIVAEENGETIGYVMCRVETGFPNIGSFGILRKGHIVSVAVLPQHQRRGVGYAMVRKALEKMSLYNAKECYLEVRASNVPAINLYKKLGFRITRTVRGYYSDGEAAHVMARKLPFEG